MCKGIWEVSFICTSYRMVPVVNRAPWASLCAAWEALLTLLALMPWVRRCGIGVPTIAAWEALFDPFGSDTVGKEVWYGCTHHCGLGGLVVLNVFDLPVAWSEEVC